MKIKAFMCIISAFCMLTAFTACSDKGGSSSESSKAESSAQSAAEESKKEITLPTKSSEALERQKERLSKIRAQVSQSAKQQEVVKKYFGFGNYGSVILDSDWILESADESKISVELDEYPAILKYKTGTDTCTVVIEDGCETEEAFAANTEESYKAAFGSQFDSIEIDEFEKLTIDNVDSFKIEAEVTAGGVEFEMLHILSNSTSANKTVSIMLLDKSGETEDLFDDFEEENINYGVPLYRDKLKTGRDAIEEKIKNGELKKYNGQRFSVPNN